MINSAQPIPRRRPLGVRFLTIYAGLVAGLTPLVLLVVLVTVGRSRGAPELTAPELVLSALLHGGILASAIGAWQGKENSRKWFVVLVAVHYAWIGLNNYLLLQSVASEVLEQSSVTSPQRLIERALRGILFPLIFFWYFNRSSTRAFYRNDLEPQATVLPPEGYGIDPGQALTAEMAVRRGHVLITLPVVCIMIATFVAGRMLGNSLNLPALPLVSIFAGPMVAWVWWSFAVPRWRHWALSRGADPDALQRLAQRQGLVWPKGHFLEKTEFPFRDKDVNHENSQAVMLHLDGTGLNEEVYESYDVAGLEDQLIDAIRLARVGQFDGNEFGPDEVILYMYGPDAEALYNAVKPVLLEHPLCEGARVVIRPGGPDTAGREVSLPRL